MHGNFHLRYQHHAILWSGIEFFISDRLAHLKDLTLKQQQVPSTMWMVCGVCDSFLHRVPTEISLLMTSRYFDQPIMHRFWRKLDGRFSREKINDHKMPKSQKTNLSRVFYSQMGVSIVFGFYNNQTSMLESIAVDVEL